MTIFLVVAALILFWFGVYAEIMVIFVALGEIYFEGTTERMFPHRTNLLINAANFTYFIFGHFVHMVAAYWLSKGRMKGMILGFSLSVFEIISFFLPTIDPSLFDLYGKAVRILFGLVIILLWLGRHELASLRTEKWRPWKNPIAVIKN